MHLKLNVPLLKTKNHLEESKALWFYMTIFSQKKN